MIETTRSFDIEKWLAEHPEEDKFKHQFLDKNPSKVLLELGVRAGHIVLDFGCGSGTYTIPTAKLVGNGGKVYALDINSSFLDVIEESAKQEGIKNIVRIDASKEGEIPLENEEIDVMLLIDVLHLIEDRAALFDEAYRVLKRGGFIIAYPMHVPEKEVEELATGRNLNLEEKKFDGRFLIFRKFANESQFSAKASQTKTRDREGLHHIKHFGKGG
jgi:ubiquinone/menaquinone biosynthesis C-methylase UbiE